MRTALPKPHCAASVFAGSALDDSNVRACSTRSLSTSLPGVVFERLQAAAVQRAHRQAGAARQRLDVGLRQVARAPR